MKSLAAGTLRPSLAVSRVGTTAISVFRARYLGLVLGAIPVANHLGCNLLLVVGRGPNSTLPSEHVAGAMVNLEHCVVVGNLDSEEHILAYAMLAVESDELAKVNELLAADPSNEVPKVHQSPAHLSGRSRVEGRISVEEVRDNIVDTLLKLRRVHDAKAIVRDSDEAATAHPVSAGQRVHVLDSLVRKSIAGHALHRDHAVATSNGARLMEWLESALLPEAGGFELVQWLEGDLDCLLRADQVSDNICRRLEPNRCWHLVVWAAVAMRADVVIRLLAVCDGHLEMWEYNVDAGL